MQNVEVNYRIEDIIENQSPTSLDFVEEFEFFYDAIKMHIPDIDCIDSEYRSLTLKLDYDNEDNTLIIAIR